MLGLAKAIHILRFASWCIRVHHDHHAIHIPTAGQKKKKLEEEINEEKDMAHFANPVVSPWR
jgi:hypothetical protein